MIAAGTVVQRRRARQTGTIVRVQRADDDGRYDENGWETVCEDHGTVCSHSTRLTAEAMAASPQTWCEVCQAFADGITGTCVGCGRDLANYIEVNAEALYVDTHGDVMCPASGGIAYHDLGEPSDG